MSIVRCDGCSKQMDTDEPGSIYAVGAYLNGKRVGDDLYCLGCFEEFEQCGLCDGQGEECETRGVWQKCSGCNGEGVVRP